MSFLVRYGNFKLRFLLVNQNFSMVSFDIFDYFDYFDYFTGRQSLFLSIF
jgi:hypothetical protein